MLGVSGMIGGQGDVAAAAEAPESGAGAGSAGDSGGGTVSLPPSAFSEAARMEEGDRNSGGGNRWPRQETLALLKIRSDMDVVFRDSSLKGPLWEEVSRKMAELGYHRNAKKCKEKFENVYKYHKRTREGRATKSDGKTYRFFDQLEAFEHSPLALPPPPSRPQPPLLAAPQPSSVVAPPQQLPGNPVIPSPVQVTVPSTVSQFGSATIQGVQNPIGGAPAFPPQSQTRSVQVPVPPPPAAPNNTSMFPPQRNVQYPGSPFSDSTWSSATSSDEDIQRRHKRKRKWKDFFERLMKDVIEKQEDLQRKFLEALEKRERDRMVREEAWRVQEMARMNREHDLLVKERSMAAAKDAAVLQFLQKVSDQHNLEISIANTIPPSQVQAPIAPESISTPTQPSPPPLSQSQQTPAHGPEPISFAPPATLPYSVSSPATPSVVPTTTTLDVVPKQDNNNNSSSAIITTIESYTPASSSRWPKTEVQALITLRTNLDTKYQESGPKGPLWEEISVGMRKLGYNRNAKRCKEKWENINKYFKKVKESNKRRPEDSKTCPYFHLLDAIYREKAIATPGSGGSSFKPENTQMLPIMAQPEQQWPLPRPEQQQQHNEHESDNMDDDGEDDDYDDEDGGGYEIVTNKQQATAPATTAAN
ncbi:unnamed protein product [Cuscuta epithymum]|uniref:Myb-like domain-containing protein n=1 Tax=Cuscuta epithymum TaxID=186058 RepID=A0AAV0E2D2_9ASTE|nr:unnamed protein product [Cuscuta epithymum]